MKRGLSRQGGGEEIRGAVGDLLGEGQLRAEQRASEGGEFPRPALLKGSVSFSLLLPQLMRKLIGFGTPRPLLIGAQRDGGWAGFLNFYPNFESTV